MSSERPRQSLPFEPKKSRKKASKAESQPAREPANDTPARETRKSAEKKTAKPSNRKPATREEAAIPEIVSQRMLFRMAILSGVPLFMAISIFVASYFIVINEVFVLPNTAVLLASLGCFGLSVLGLSYGIFSTSWDEDQAGTVVGWQEFKLNIGRTVQAWKEARRESRAKIKN
ncbi:PAM68 family protein [Capilliphycus salinus ALCB114379]|uniref:PAM68 family protein n=1 Tax=Capilliphycus salinus TaxID=2768948 RepID=UPI0039A44986